MSIPYENEAVAVTTAANPVAGATLKAGLSIADILGIRISTGTQHIAWNEANNYAQKAADTVASFIKSRVSVSQISQALPFIVTQFREQRERYWLNTRNADIDKSINEYSGWNDPAQALRALLWLLFVWIDTSIPKDGTGYADHSRTLYGLIVVRAFERTGAVKENSPLWQNVKFEPLWGVTISGSPMTTTGGTGLPDNAGTLAASFGSGGSLLIGIGLVGALVYSLWKGK